MIDHVRIIFQGNVSSNLKSLINRLRRKRFARNWELNYSVPQNQKNDFIRSVTMGTLDFPVKNDNVNILLCAQPKSASLYMVQLLSLSLKLTNHQIGFNKAGGSIYYPRLLTSKFTGNNTISHCHTEPNRNVLQMISTLDLRPLVLTRNLLDALVSRRDMLIRDKRASNILSELAIQRFITGSEEYQMDVIIDLFASNYINFFSGWDQYRQDRNIKPIYITYEQLVNDEMSLVQRVACEFNIRISNNRIRAVSAKIAKAGGINYSTGLIGRGRQFITKRQIKHLRQKAEMLGCNNEDFLGFRI